MTVSLAPLKAAIDDQLSKLTDVLVRSLRNAVTAKVKDVEMFVENGMQRLKKEPRTVEDMTAAKKDWQEMSDTKGAKRAQLDLCGQLKQLLLSVAGLSVDIGDVASRLARLTNDWGAFETSLENFSNSLEAARERMKGDVEASVVAANDRLVKFQQRWDALKPKEMKSWSSDEVGKVFSFLEERRGQLDELKASAQMLMDNCVSFGMPVPRFEALGLVEDDVTKTEDGWSKFGVYLDERAEIAKRDWVTARASLHEITLFATKWSDDFRARKVHDLIFEHMVEETDAVRSRACGPCAPSHGLGHAAEEGRIGPEVCPWRSV